MDTLDNSLSYTAAFVHSPYATSGRRSRSLLSWPAKAHDGFRRRVRLFPAAAALVLVVLCLAMLGMTVAVHETGRIQRARARYRAVLGNALRRRHRRAEDGPSSDTTTTMPPAAVVVVGFGACNRIDRANQTALWSVVGETLAHRGGGGGDREVMMSTTATTAWVWLGDAVYADKNVAGVWMPDTLPAMADKFTAFKRSAPYASFVASRLSMPPTGVWDDHDMGLNDGVGRTFALRDSMQEAFLDFVDDPADSPRRGRRDGLYQFVTIPFPPTTTACGDNEGGSERHPDGDMMAVCVIQLDVRSVARQPSDDTDDDDALGPAQWRWLNQTLQEPSPATNAGRTVFDICALTILTSGIQFLSDEKPTDSWGQFPRSRTRLFDLLARTNPSGERMVFLSGDVHYADLLAVRVPGVRAPIVEITSTGLSHSLSDVTSNDAFDWLHPSARRFGRFLGRNFGSVAVTRDEATVMVHDAFSGQPVIGHRIALRRRRSNADNGSPVHVLDRLAIGTEDLVDAPPLMAVDLAGGLSPPGYSLWMFKMMEAVAPAGAISFAMKHRVVETVARAAMRLISAFGYARPL